MLSCYYYLNAIIVREVLAHIIPIQFIHSYLSIKVIFFKNHLIIRELFCFNLVPASFGKRTFLIPGVIVKPYRLHQPEVSLRSRAKRNASGWCSQYGLTITPAFKKVLLPNEARTRLKQKIYGLSSDFKKIYNFDR